MLERYIKHSFFEKSLHFHLHMVLGNARLKRFTMYRRLGRRSLVYCPDGFRHPLKELKLTTEQYARRQLGYIPEAYLKDEYGVRTDLTQEERLARQERYTAIKDAAREKHRAHMREQYLKSLGEVR
ncbi:MAG: hypothetical protein IJY01_03755 [Clostridia bacterium]|nr:hypothetical protein [Clostridia bacterium]